MSTSTAVTENVMAKPSSDEAAYQIRCKRDWLARVQKAAKALGLRSSADYIRMVVTQRMDQDGIDPPKPPRK